MVVRLRVPARSALVGDDAQRLMRRPGWRSLVMSMGSAISSLGEKMEKAEAWARPGLR